MTRVLIIGGAGQLAHDLRDRWQHRRPADDVVSLTHVDVEISDAASVTSALRSNGPDVVVNTSAYHKVDDVELHPKRAFAVNAIGPLNLALACRELGAVLIHLSTDYVFTDGRGQPIPEATPVNPPNVYGVSKAAGEMLIRSTWHKHFIVRSSGLYGTAGSSGKGGNFVETMLRLAATDKPIKVVNDQVLSPTATRWLAEQIVELSSSAMYGTLHAACHGACSWYEFAAEVFRQAGLSPTLTPQGTAESGAAARRPTYSVLDNAALRGMGIDLMPSWQEALAEYLTMRSTTAKTAST